MEKDFSFADRGTVIIATSLGFIIALAMNDAFKQTFKHLKIGGSGLIGAWIYAAMMLIIGLVLIWFILTRVKTWLQ